MTDLLYEYRGLMASTWDFFRGDTSRWSDKIFYRTLIEQYGEPVLDVGCGTGRLLLDYLEDGVDVEGVDNSPEMLALCRDKAQARGLKPVVYEQWMENLDLPRQYRTLLVPSSSFQLVTDTAKAAQAMQKFYHHLLSGAALVMPFMLVDTESRTEDWQLVGEKTRPEDGAIVRRWMRTWTDAEAQLEDTETRYEVERDGIIVASETIRQSPALRWYTQTQACELYEANGFKVAMIYDGFNMQPASATSDLFVVVGEKLV